MGEAWTTLTRCPQAHSHNSNRQVLSRDGTKDRRRQRFQLRKQTRWSRRSGPLQPMRLVTAPCPQQCQLSCNDDERVFSFYRVRGAQPTPVVTDDRTVSFGRSNRPPWGDAFLFCTKR